MLALLVALAFGYSAYSCRQSFDKPATAVRAAVTSDGETVTPTGEDGPSPSDEGTSGDNGATAANEATTSGGLELPRMTAGPSRGGQTIRHTGFTLCYDADYKTPYWVAWTLTPAKLSGDVARTNKFLPDPMVRGAQAVTKDYTNSGYDRGHMAPAADMKWSIAAMRESFYLTNVCPQNRNLNRGDWNDLEEAVRTWARRYGPVYVCAGPLYFNKRPTRIGANGVAVPDAFFKVVLIGYPQHPRAYGFIFANRAGSQRLEAYQRTVDDVERTAGMDFFSALPDNVENRIEAQKPALP